MHRTTRVVLSCTLVLTSLATSSCSTRASRPNTEAVAMGTVPCDGQLFVEVNNSLEVTVDVLAYRMGSGAPTFNCTAPPGKQRLPSFSDVT